MKSVVVRVDASSHIGTGHVSRCVTLMKCLKQRDFDITFVCRELPGNMVAEIRKEGFAVCDIEVLEKGNWDWLVVDHYELDYSFEIIMRSKVKKILVIDDLADRSHDCDLLLDQNLYDGMESRYRGLVPANCQVLTGPRYALLRPEFVEARRHAQRDSELHRILVFFGGSDPTNETEKVLRAISQFNRTDIFVDILVGLSNPHRDKLQTLVSALPRMALLEHVKKISKLMLNADLAIGGGGATSWERCCLGLPSIIVAVADNQIAISQTLSDRGYQIYLGESKDVSAGAIAEALNDCTDHFSDAVAMGLNSMELVDGLGTGRVVAAMLRT